MSIRIQADVIVVSDQQVLAPGQIVVQHGRILEATAHLAATADILLNEMAIVPGLINPHTHLEFSDLDQPLPAGANFPQWIGQVLSLRHGRIDPVGAKAAAIERGLDESRRAGVVALADIISPPWSPPDLTAARARRDADRVLPSAHFSQAQRELWAAHLPDESTPQVIACIEQLGLSPERSQQAMQWRDLLLDAPASAYPSWVMQWAFSPHAPYSTPPHLWQQTLSLAAERRAMVAMHLAESPAERQWIDEGTGPMAEMLAQMGIASTAQPRLLWDIIENLARAPRGLVIHGNYLLGDEMDRLSRYRDRLSVVYCPRTHRHFAHQPYPLDELLARGISVVLGTDSRSTNPDLNLWREALTALTIHPTWKPSQALAAITSQAARALGLEDHYGTLLPGTIAQFQCLPAPHAWHNLEELFEALISTGADGTSMYPPSLEKSSSF